MARPRPQLVTFTWGCELYPSTESAVRDALTIKMGVQFTSYRRHNCTVFETIKPVSIGIERYAIIGAYNDGLKTGCLFC